VALMVSAAMTVDPTQASASAAAKQRAFKEPPPVVQTAPGILPSGE
jgi:hypothetical protein